MRIKNLLMISGVFIIGLFNSLPGISATEVEQIIDYSFGQKVVRPYWEAKFSGKITFDPLPELLKTSTVQLKIMAMCDFDFDPEFIVITAYNNLIEFTQLIPTTWPPPIREGDIYEGTFTITPTEMGKFNLEIVPKADPIKLHQRFGFFLTIDESQKLVHLSKMRDFDYTETTIHPPAVGNEIELKYRVGKHLDGSIKDDFVNIFHISPLPALNETSTVGFQLTSNRECPEGVQFYLSWTENMELFDLPNSWVGEVKIGDVHIDTFKIIPKSTGCSQFRLHARAISTAEGTTISTKYSDEATELYVVTFFINESGKLTFIGREPAKYIQEPCQQYKRESYMSQPKVFIESQLKRKEK